MRTARSASTSGDWLPGTVFEIVLGICLAPTRPAEVTASMTHGSRSTRAMTSLRSRSATRRRYRRVIRGLKDLIALVALRLSSSVLLRHSVLAHGIAVQAIRAKGKSGTKVGPAENINVKIGDHGPGAECVYPAREFW
jgi:hypothetical protein